MTILGTPFVDVGAQDAVLNIQAIKPSDTENSGGVSMLRIWNGSSYDIYTYYPAEEYGVGENEIPGWGDNDQNEADVDIDLGAGYWIQSAKSETITIAGQVSDENTVPIRAGLTLVSNPLPMDIDIQGIVPSDTENSGGVSMLRMWNGTSYNIYTYYPAEEYGVGENEVPGWGDNDQNEVHVTISAGCGVWIQSAKAETLTFQNN